MLQLKRTPLIYRIGKITAVGNKAISLPNLIKIRTPSGALPDTSAGVIKIYTYNQGSQGHHTSEKHTHAKNMPCIYE